MANSPNPTALEEVAARIQKLSAGICAEVCVYFGSADEHDPIDPRVLDKIVRNRLMEELSPLFAELEKLREELREARENYNDMAWDSLLQGVGPERDGLISDMALSTYEYLCNHFVTIGWLEPVGGKYRIVPTEKRPPSGEKGAG